MDNEYKNVKKIFDICAILQCLYYLGCIIVMICMPLYTIYYPSAFSEVCFKIGVIFTFASTFNPICFLSFICLLIVYCIDHYLIKKKKTKVLMIVWLVISPVLQIMCWIFAVGAFVAHSGGV